MITIYAGLKNGSKHINLNEFEGSVAHEFEEALGAHCGVSWWVLDGDEVRQPNDTELADRQKVIDRKALKDQKDIDLMSVTVEINGNEIWANPTEEQNISGRLRQMEVTGALTCKWIQGEDIYTLTKEELAQVLAEGTAQCSQIFDDYIAAMEAI
jgi:hypothetical protein